jgi:hypothetical protein
VVDPSEEDDLASHFPRGELAARVRALQLADEFRHVASLCSGLGPVAGKGGSLPSAPALQGPGSVARGGKIGNWTSTTSYGRAPAVWLPGCTSRKVPWVASFFPARPPARSSSEPGSYSGPRRRCARTSPLLGPRGHVRRRCFPSGRPPSSPLPGPSRGRASETVRRPALGKLVPMRGRLSGTG